MKTQRNKKKAQRSACPPVTQEPEALNFIVRTGPNGEWLLLPDGMLDAFGVDSFEEHEAERRGWKAARASSASVRGGEATKRQAEAKREKIRLHWAAGNPQTGAPWKSQSELARMLHVSEKTIARALKTAKTGQG
jgi:DNA-binding CsgD family transcriptional regulator